MAKTKRTFTMNGNVYTSMAAIADELGVSRIRPKDFSKYGIVENTDDNQDIVPADTTTTDDSTDTVDKAEEATAEVKADAADAADEADAKEATEVKPEQTNPNKEKKESKSKAVKAEKPEKKSDKAEKKPEQTKKEKEVVTIDNLVAGTIEDFSKKMRKVTIEDILKFAGDNGINTYEEVTNDSIRRMKIVSDIRTKYFGEQKVDHKKSGFEKIDTDTLLKLAEDNSLTYKKSSNEPIQRMWVIVALKAAGVAVPAPVADNNTDNTDDGGTADSEN
jgi:hypothetical protein